MNYKISPVPGINTEYPMKAFTEFNSLARRLWRKDCLISMANFLYPAINQTKPLGVIFLKHNLFTHSELYSHIA